MVMDKVGKGVVLALIIVVTLSGQGGHINASKTTDAPQPSGSGHNEDSGSALVTNNHNKLVKNEGTSCDGCSTDDEESNDPTLTNANRVVSHFLRHHPNAAITYTHNSNTLKHKEVHKGKDRDKEHAQYMEQVREEQKKRDKSHTQRLSHEAQMKAEDKERHERRASMEDSRKKAEEQDGKSRVKEEESKASASRAEQDAKHKRNMADKEEASAKNMKRKEEGAEKQLRENKLKFRATQEAAKKKREAEAKRVERAAKQVKQEAGSKERALTVEEEKKKTAERKKKNMVQEKAGKSESQQKRDVEVRVKRKKEKHTKAEREHKSFVERVRKRPRTKLRRNCLAWGDPHYVTFDHRKYDFYAEGEYVFYEDKNWAEIVTTEIKKPQRSWPVSYNTGVAFKSRWHRIAIQYKNPRRTYDPRVFLDGHLVKWKNGAQYKAGSLVVFLKWQPGMAWRGRQIALIKNTDSNTYVTINSNYHGWRGETMKYMDVRVHVDGYFRPPSTRGMCGVFDGSTSNEYIRSNGQRTNNARGAAATWRVPTAKSLFQMHTGITLTAAQIVKKASSLTPLQLAGGNQKLVNAAKHACAKVPQATRSECVTDFICGGGPRVVAEAKHEAKALMKNAS